MSEPTLAEAQIKADQLYPFKMAAAAGVIRLLIRDRLNS